MRGSGGILRNQRVLVPIGVFDRPDPWRCARNRTLFVDVVDYSERMNNLDGWKAGRLIDWHIGKLVYRDVDKAVGWEIGNSIYWKLFPGPEG